MTMWVYIPVCVQKYEVHMKKKRKNNTVGQIYMRDYSYTYFPLFSATFEFI